MADDEVPRTARPRPNANPEQLGKAQRKYKTFSREASTEYERLLAIDKTRKLAPNNNAAEHAIFFHLCSLREGMLHVIILIRLI